MSILSLSSPAGKWDPIVFLWRSNNERVPIWGKQWNLENLTISAEHDYVSEWERNWVVRCHKEFNRKKGTAGGSKSCEGIECVIRVTTYFFKACVYRARISCRADSPFSTATFFCSSTPTDPCPLPSPALWVFSSNLVDCACQIKIKV